MTYGASFIHQVDPFDAVKYAVVIRNSSCPQEAHSPVEMIRNKYKEWIERGKL